MELFVGFVGLDLGSVLVNQTNPYTTGPFTINPQNVDQSLTQSSMGGCWNQVSTPWDGRDVSLYLLLLPSPKSLSLRAYRSTLYPTLQYLREFVRLTFAQR